MDITRDRERECFQRTERKRETQEGGFKSDWVRREISAYANAQRKVASLAIDSPTPSMPGHSEVALQVASNPTWSYISTCLYTRPFAMLLQNPSKLRRGQWGNLRLGPLHMHGATFRLYLQEAAKTSAAMQADSTAMESSVRAVRRLAIVIHSQPHSLNALGSFVCW